MATDLQQHPLVRDYLEQVERSTLDLPWARRRELLESVEDHLADRLGSARDTASVADALERLGPPEQVATAEPPAARRTVARWLRRLRRQAGA